MLLVLLFGAFLAFTATLQANANLTWQDNSDNEDGFYIERSENGGSFNRIASLPKNTTTFSDSNTSPGVIYRYRVQAFNAFGVSGYTNISLFELPNLIRYEDWIARFLSTEIDLNLATLSLELSSSEVSTIQLFSPTPTDPNNTLDGAQLPNLLCYAHGINPFKPDLTLLANPGTTLLQGKEVRTIERAVFKYSVGVVTTLQCSSDMRHWKNLPLHTQVTRETSMHRWERILLPQDSETCFYRLKVSLAPQQSI